jgi:DNA-binding CsgD family transcriptional regulator
MSANNIYCQNEHIKLFGTYQKILNQLNAENFGFLKVNNDLTYSYFSSDNKSAAEYILKVTSTNVFYNEFIAMDHFNGQDFYYVSWPEKPTSLSMQIYLDHGFWNGLSVISYVDNSLQIWWVANKPENQGIQKLYMSPLYRQKLLIAIDYFNKKCEQELGSNLGHYQFENFDFISPVEEKKKQNAILLQEKKKLIESFYPNGILVRSKGRIIKLTLKEVRILELLACGLSAKEIARNTSSQSKTIENQKEALKNKVGFSVKSDLVKLYNDQVSMLFK